MHVFLDVPRRDFEPAVRFWSDVTGGTPSWRRGEFQEFLTLQPPIGQPWVKMQATAAHTGVHLDLDSPDVGAATARSTGLGATPAWVVDGIQVMRSPGGFTFCHTPGSDACDLPRHAGSILDQVTLDIPKGLWEAEVAFWTHLLDRPLAAGSRPEFALLAAPNAPRVLLQRLDNGEGPVRGHVDFACSDRVATTKAHRAVGAVIVSEQPYWTVMRAPSGHHYCLTERDPLTGVLSSPG